jgi:hypothetical protein
MVEPYGENYKVEITKKEQPVPVSKPFFAQARNSRLLEGKVLFRGGSLPGVSYCKRGGDFFSDQSQNNS